MLVGMLENAMDEFDVGILRAIGRGGRDGECAGLHWWAYPFTLSKEWETKHYQRPPSRYHSLQNMKAPIDRSICRILSVEIRSHFE